MATENPNIQDIVGKMAALKAELAKVIVGQQDVIDQIIITLLAGGHALLTGVPGLGKTLLVKTVAQLFSLSFKRIQFTPDLMPADIFGTEVLQEDPATGTRAFKFIRGPVFANIVLADEINRTPPKTQAALLEAMGEYHVTSAGKTIDLERPFFVLATQNPIELEGTYPIPEAQLDRFLFKLEVTGVDAPVLAQIISQRRRGEPPAPTWHLTPEQLQGLFDAMDAIHLAEPVADYIARLVAAGHPNNTLALPEINKYVTFGASPRAAIALAEAARAAALLDGRPTVGFDDVKSVALPVLNHRLILNYQAKLEKVTTASLINLLLEKTSPAAL